MHPNGSASPAPAMLTVKELHELIGTHVITRQGLYLAIARGEIPSVKLGRRILIPRAAAETKLSVGRAH